MDYPSLERRYRCHREENILERLQKNSHQILELEGSTWENDVKSPLLPFRRNVFSQSGEDGVIERIIELLPEVPRTFVEFGAWDGLHLSNCARLARDLGWMGVFIEGNPVKFQDLTANYAGFPRIVTVNRWVTLATGSTLDEIVQPYLDSVGILSIDIDGNDYHIWDSVNHLKPMVVVIEVNPSIPNDVRFVQRYSLDVNQGASLLAINELAIRKGYELVCCTSANAFFVDKRYFNRFNIKDNSIDKLYVPKCNGRIFHGFDGTVFVVGMDRIIWKGVKVTSDHFQIFPEHERKLT